MHYVWQAKISTIILSVSSPFVALLTGYPSKLTLASERDIKVSPRTWIGWYLTIVGFLTRKFQMRSIPALCPSNPASSFSAHSTLDIVRNLSTVTRWRFSTMWILSQLLWYYCTLDVSNLSNCAIIWRIRIKWLNLKYICLLFSAIL